MLCQIRDAAGEVERRLASVAGNAIASRSLQKKVSQPLS
jgi:hypothetical protein